MHIRSKNSLKLSFAQFLLQAAEKRTRTVQCVIHVDVRILWKKDLFPLHQVARRIRSVDVHTHEAQEVQQRGSLRDAVVVFLQPADVHDRFCRIDLFIRQIGTNVVRESTLEPFFEKRRVVHAPRHSGTPQLIAIEMMSQCHIWQKLPSATHSPGPCGLVQGIDSTILVQVQSHPWPERGTAPIVCFALLALGRGPAS